MATEHRIQLTGQELDERLAQVLTNEEDIGREQQTRETADEGMQEQLGAISTRMDAQDTTNEQVATDIENLQKAIGTGGSVDDKIAAAVGAEATAREAADTALGGRITTLEAAVGTGGSVDERIATEAAARADADTALGNRMTTLEGSVDDRLDQQDAAIGLLDGHKLMVVDVLPTEQEPAVTPKSDIIYRLVITDSETGDVSYEDYMYNEDDLTTPKKIANYPLPGIDDEPTPGSRNLVESGGIANYTKKNTVEETTLNVVDLDVAGYITDKNMKVIGKLMDDGAVEWLVKNSRDKQVDTHLENLDVSVEDAIKETSVGDEDEGETVANYIIDKNNYIIAEITKEGAIETFVKNSKEKAVDDFLSYVSSEIPGAASDIIKYITDKNGTVIATVNNVGVTEFKGGGGFDGEITKSQTISLDAVKVLTDNEGAIIGWITNEGKVHVVELEAEKLSVDDSADIGIPDHIFPLFGLLANGTKHMRDFVNDKSYNLLYNIPKGKYIKTGIPIKTVPTIIIHDDDVIDSQLPSGSSRGATDTTRPSSTTTGGYASILLPIILAINAKHKGEINAENGKITIGIAGEGQRIGLTPLYGHEDIFNSQLNNNGKVLKKIVEHEGWEVLCHSMTARYNSYSFVVNGLDSSFAQTVLEHSNWGGDLFHSTTVCYNEADGKNYQIKQDKSGWDELPSHYIKPYCAFSLVVNGTTIINPDYQELYSQGVRIIINPTYSVKYQVDTWFNRCAAAGLPYVDRAVVNWGSSHSIWHLREDLKYADVVFGRHNAINTIPVDTTIVRVGYSPSASRNGVVADRYNVYTELEYNRLIDYIDECIQDNGLLVLYGHTGGDTSQVNYYFPELDYPTTQTGTRLNYKDGNYPDSWKAPLKYEHLQDLLTNPDSEYWVKPPLMRRNIDGTISDERMESWAEYYPCPGTTMAMFYDVIEYAISKGVRFSTSRDAIDKFGNMFNIGFKKSYGDTWGADTQLGNIPEQNSSHYVIGVDASIICEIK